MSHFDPLRTTDGDCPECGAHVPEVDRLKDKLHESNAKYEQAMYYLRDGLGVGEFQDINSVGRWKQRVLDAFPELLE